MRSDGPEALGLNPTRSARGPQQLHSLRSGDIATDGAFEPGAGDDVAGLAAGAAIKVGNQFAHRPVAAGEQ
jgi:hypothetical protein